MIEPTFVPPAEVLRWISETAELIVNFRAFVVLITCLAWLVAGAMVRKEPQPKYETFYEGAARRIHNRHRWRAFVPALLIGLAGAALLIRGPI